MHVNKVAYIRTIDLVARKLGEDIDALDDVILASD